jgi:hypothetical protein
MRSVIGAVAAAAILPAALGSSAFAQGPVDKAGSGKAPAAQGATRPSIEVASSVTAGSGETKLSINVTRTEAMPRGSFIRIRGLPSDSTMSEGFAIAPSLWAVPLNSLANLRIRLSNALKGDVPITIALATIDGDVLAEARSTLRPVGAGNAAPPPLPPNGASANPKPAVSMLPPPPVPARPPVPAAVDPNDPAPPPPDALPSAEELPLTPEQVRALGYITRGRELLGEGNVAAARLLFERAAKVGLAYGALGLGETFDPIELRAHRVLGGIAPDPEAARRWYRQAAQLGAPEADERLQRLEGR